MATDVSGIVSEIQKVFGDNLKNPSTILNSFFEFLSKNDPEVLSIQKEFKRKYLIPLLKAWDKLTKDVDKNALKASEVFNKLDKFFSSFEQETKNIVNQNNKKFNNTIEDIKNVYLSQNKYENTQQPSVLQDNSNKNNYENILNTSDSPTEEKLIEKNQPETIISFSLPTISLIDKWIKQLSNDNAENLKKLNLGQTKKGSILDSLLDLATSLPVLFAAIGGASALAGMFWPEIKKYIGEKFGDKAEEVFDQFQGTVTGLTKFISIGGLQVTVGKTFQTLGSLLGKVADDFASGAIKIFGGIFDNLLGVGGTAAAGAADNVAGAAIGKGLGSTLQKGGSLLFRGLSKTALRGIPLIGSIISFSDAWGRFKEGDYAQGIIDIGAGLTAFVPGIGTGLSIGLSVMNAIIDFKSPEEKKELIQKTFNIAGMLTKGVGVYAKLMGGPVLKRIPLIGSLFNFASAKEKFDQNNILGGTLDLASGIAAFVPGVGLPVSIGLDILSSIIGTQEAKESGVQQTGFDFAKMALKATKFVTKLGKPFFKRIPFLGSLLSFADAWDNFQNDNILAGSLDLVSGVANLFPGIGTALSLGVDVLNSLMSQKTESGKTRFQAVGDWFSGVWEWVKETPVMKAFFDLYDGIEAVFMGDMPRAFKTLSNIPLIGGMFESIGKALSLDTKSSATINSSKPFKTNNTQKIIDNLPTKYNKEEEDKLIEQDKVLISKRKKIEDDKTKTEQQPVKDRSEADDKNKKIQELNNNLETLVKERHDLQIQILRQKELKEGKKFENKNSKEDKLLENNQSVSDNNISEEDNLKSKLQNKVSELTKIQKEKSRDPKRLEKITSLRKEIEELTNSVHANDFDETNMFNLPIKQKNFSYQPSYGPNFASGKYVFLPKDERITSFNDKGPINDTFKQLNKNIEKLTEKMLGVTNEISVLALKQQNMNNNQSPTIVNNNNTTQSTNKLDMFSTRDQNMMARYDYIRNNSYNRTSYT
jgi:hypothetical protein